MNALRASSKQVQVTYVSYIREMFSSIFSSRGWPEWIGRLLLGLANVLFFIIASKPFTVYSGFYNGGLNFYHLSGLDSKNVIHPLADKTSVGDLGLFVGAMLAAAASGELKLRLAHIRDYIESAIGGILMAVGVCLAWGCN